MTRRKFNAEQEQEIIQLYQSGLSSIKLAKRLKCDKSVILGILKRNGVAARNNKALSPEQERRLIELYQSGEQLQDIAETFGIRPPTVTNILKRHGLRKPARGRHGNCKLTPAEEEQVVKIHQAGYTAIAIARAYNLGHKAIKGAIKRQGAKILVGHSFNEGQIADILQLYCSGLSLSKLAKKYGVAPKVIRKILTEHKIEIRPNRQYRFNRHAFDDLNKEESLYWLGFLYADGNVNRNTVRIGLASKDSQHLKKLIIFLESETRVIIKKKVATVEFNHHLFAHKMRRLGIVVGRSEFRRTEQLIPDEMAHHFIRGYLDGDGCLSKDERVIFLGQYDILKWICQKFHKHIGINPNNKMRDRGNILEISWGGRIQSNKIIEYIYKDATVWLERKRNVTNLWRK